MKTIRLQERQVPNHRGASPERLAPKQKSGAGLMWLSILSTLAKWGSAAAFIYVLFWCLDHFGILQRILWIAE